MEKRKQRTDAIERELFFKEIALNNYELVRQAITSLDQKIHNIIVLCSSLLAVILGFSYFIFESQQITCPGFILILLTIFSLLISLSIGLFSYKPIKFPTVEALKLIQKYSKSKYLIILQRFNDTLADITNEHVTLNNSKAYGLKWMMFLLGTGLFFFALALIVFLYSIN